MLRQKHADFSFRGEHVVARYWAGGGAEPGPKDDSSGEGIEPDETGDAPLDDAARGERDYVRRRLREELQREPTESELDEWLRQHTEGY